MMQQGRVHLSAHVWGCVLCLALTLAAYALVVEQVWSGWIGNAAVLTLAVGQVAVQLVLFFSLGKEGKPHWNLWFFFFTILIFLVVILGSLWIMANLDYRMMA